MSDYLSLPEKRLCFLEKKRSDFEVAYEAGLITKARYQILLSEWHKSYERAIKRLDKLEAEAGCYVDYGEQEKFSLFKSFYEAIKDQNIVKESLYFYRGSVKLLRNLTSSGTTK